MSEKIERVTIAGSKYDRCELWADEHHNSIRYRLPLIANARRKRILGLGWRPLIGTVAIGMTISAFVATAGFILAVQ